jgi:hypothetical protein
MGMLTQTQSMTDAVGDITSQVGDQMAGFDDQTSMITGAFSLQLNLLKPQHTFGLL